MTFTSILCPVDFSTHSRDAIQHAVAVAHRFDAHITAMFVNDPLLLAAASRTAGGQQQFITRTRRELERFVTRSIAPRSPMHDKIALIVTTGNPADEILHTVKRLRSDLIVIGTQGLSGFRKMFFGSTTEQVLRRATVPVLAIPPSTLTRRHRRTRPMAITRVVAPIDLAGEWESDAIRAARLAAAFNSELVLVHVLAPLQTPPWLRSTGATIRRRRLEAARRALERVKAKLSRDLTITTRVLEGNPAHEIAQVTANSPCLVAMSLRGGAGILGARRGSIAYHVLTHSSTPVLALPRRRLGGRFPTRLAKAVTDVLSERDRIEMAGIDALLSMLPPRRHARKAFGK